MAQGALMWICIVGVVVIVGGFYLQNRYQDAATLAHLTSINQIQDLPPSTCYFKESNYGNGSSGTIYVYKNRMRFDIPSLRVTNYDGQGEAVISTDGSRFMTPQMADAISQSPSVTPISLLNTVLANAPWICSPWWSPTDAMFNLTNGISF